MSKLDYEYPSVDIAEQVKLFVLHNQAKGTVLANPDAAFEMWMRRIPDMKVEVKRRPSPAPAAGGPFDPAALARGLERVAEMKAKFGEKDDASENWLAAAGHWMREQGEKGEDVLRCTEMAIKDARKGSWAWEQAMQFKEKLSGSSEDQADTGQRNANRPAAGGGGG